MRLPPRLISLSIVAFLVAACGMGSQAIPGRPWKLVSIGGRPPVAEARLEFGNDGRLTFQPGCNTGGGPYSIDGNRIRTGDLVRTAMLCADDAVNGQEAVFLAVLDGDPVFAVDAGTGDLRLEGNGTSLVFVTP
jgi:heat shock protein HslJ